IEYKRDPLSASFSIRRLAGVLRDNRSFRTLYAANAVSQLGDWFNVVALFSLLLELTGKGEAVAFALLTRFVPMSLAGPAAGVVADRLSRRAIMMTAPVLRAGLVLCLLFIRRPEQAWIAYAVVTAHSLVSAFFEPAQQAMLPNLVTEADYPLAATLENSLWAATLAVGSALGGVALAVVGRDLAFAADAASFLVSAALIARLPSGYANRADRQAMEMVEEARAPGSQIENLLGVRPRGRERRREHPLDQRLDAPAAHRPGCGAGTGRRSGDRRIHAGAVRQYPRDRTAARPRRFAARPDGGLRPDRARSARVLGLRAEGVRGDRAGRKRV